MTDAVGVNVGQCSEQLIHVHLREGGGKREGESGERRESDKGGGRREGERERESSVQYVTECELVT